MKNESDIRAELKRVKRLRFICYGPFAFTFVLYLTNALVSRWVKIDFGPIEFILFIWVVYGLLRSYSVGKFECPLCGNKFHSRRYGNGFLSLSRYNNLTKKCMNCGLELNGSNINSLITVRDKGSVASLKT